VIDLGKKCVLGVQVDAVDYEGAVARIIAAAHARQPYAVSALAVHGVMTGVLDRTHRYRLNHLDLVCPDGQPVRWALNLLHRARLPDRVYGPNLMLSVCERAAQENLPLFLFGGKQELLEALSANLQQRFPQLIIAGKKPSRFRKLSDDEARELAAEIRASGAAITLVGLGCPRQEVWAFEMREAVSMPLLAVGAAFNFHAGELPQAPRWLQDRGLEWLYRLVQEPRRLWQRYLLLNPLYLSLLTLQWVRLRELDPAEDAAPSERVQYG
jgi:N-acetylglucosaminyldiphosphoundecaprenol N-acetyl-beta-D-mannosaminyltransferase